MKTWRGRSTFIRTFLVCYGFFPLAPSMHIMYFVINLVHEKMKPSTIGLEINEARPDDKLPYRGAWLWVGSEMIHLMELPNPDPLTGRPEHGGRDRHTCVEIRDVSKLKAILDEAGKLLFPHLKFISYVNDFGRNADWFTLQLSILQVFHTRLVSLGGQQSFFEIQMKMLWNLHSSDG